MQDNHYIRWEPLSGINYPCADISFGYVGGNLWIIMHFSRVKGLKDRDLKLVFKGPITFRWANESAEISKLPDSVPKCTDAAWLRWTFPLLRVENSSWMKQHENRNPIITKNREHFVLIAMNDCIELMALPGVEEIWIEPDNNH